MRSSDWNEGLGGGNSQLTTAVQTLDSKSTSGVAFCPEDTETESSEAMLGSIDQNRDWHAWAEPQSSGGRNSPPWRRLGPPSNAGDATSHEAGLSSLWIASGAVAQCATRIWSGAARAWASSLAAAQAWLTAEETPPSRYVALIPLSDERLKPRKTKLIVGALMLFALALAIAVFFLVPRGVSIGKIAIHSDSMSWNKTLRTFQLSLKAEIPFKNPNYLPATLFGRLHIMFFDAETGKATIPPTLVPARSNAYEINVSIDASNVPSNYTLTIMEHCLGTLEPRTLVFFLKGHLHASYFYQNQDLTEIDTYFMIDCVLINSFQQEHLSPGDAITDIDILSTNAVPGGDYGA